MTVLFYTITAVILAFSLGFVEVYYKRKRKKGESDKKKDLKNKTLIVSIISALCLISCLVALILLSEDRLEEQRNIKKEIEVLLEDEGIKIEDSYIEKVYGEFNPELVYKVYSGDTIYIVSEGEELEIKAKIKGN